MRIGTREMIDAYYASEAVSQSQLKSLLMGYFPYRELRKNPEKKLYFEEPSEELIRGSAVDCLITRGREAFTNEYYISVMTTKPSDTIMSMVKYVFDKRAENNLPASLLSDDLNRQFIIEAINMQNYQPKWGEDAKVNRVISDGSAYFADLTQCGNKQILSFEEYQLINTIYNNAMNNHVIQKHIVDNDEWSYFYQVPLYFKYNDIQFKILPDIIRVNFYHGKIQVIDLKVHYEANKNYPKLMRKRGTAFQLSFYTWALKKEEVKAKFKDFIVENMTEDFRNLSSFTSFEVLNPLIVAMSSTYPSDMAVFGISDDLYETTLTGKPEYFTTGVGHEGFVTSIRHTPFIGIEGAIDKYSKMLKIEHDYGINNDTDNMVTLNNAAYLIDFEADINKPIMLDSSGVVNYPSNDVDNIDDLRFAAVSVL